MAILVDDSSRAIVQGITGTVGRNVAGLMVEGVTTVVGGVTPGRGGQEVHGLPVFNSCHEAVAETGADCSFMAVPAPFAMEACLEAVDAGIKTITVYTEEIPIADGITMAAYARARGSVVLGTNAAGCVSVDMTNISDLNDRYLMRGPVGVVAKSGAITYEVAESLRKSGLGVSTVVCLGGDPVLATYHRDILERFEADAETELVVMLGEIGGRSELAASKFVATMKTPVVSLILGRAAVPGKCMGHAGALLGGDDENWESKTEALRGAGAVIAGNILEIGEKARQTMEKR